MSRLQKKFQKALVWEEKVTPDFLKLINEMVEDVLV